MYVAIGITVLCIGIVIQRLVVTLYNRQKRNIKKQYGQYFDFDISSSEHSIASFVKHLYPTFQMSDKDVLWALSDDNYPCVVAYSKTQMLVCDVELRNGEICRRNNRTETIDFTPSCINMIWLFRQSEIKPVYEVDFSYRKEGVTKDLALIRFSLDVDGGMNYHKFRSFINTIKTCCQEKKLPIREVIRPG